MLRVRFAHGIGRCGVVGGLPEPESFDQEPVIAFVQLSGLREVTAELRHHSRGAPDLPSDLDRSLKEQQQVYVAALVGLTSDQGAVKHKASVALAVETSQAAVQIPEYPLKRPRLDVHTLK